MRSAIRTSDTINRVELDFSAVWKYGRELLLLGLRKDGSSITRLFLVDASVAISGVRRSRGIHGVVNCPRCLLYPSIRMVH